MADVHIKHINQIKEQRQYDERNCKKETKNAHDFLYLEYVFVAKRNHLTGKQWFWTILFRDQGWDDSKLKTDGPKGYIDN